MKQVYQIRWVIWCVLLGPLLFSCKRPPVAPIIVPSGESIGSYEPASPLRLGYLLAHTLVHQIEQYRVFATLDAKGNSDGCSVIEPALHLNLLRAIWLIKASETPPQARDQLLDCLDRAKTQFTKRPTHIRYGVNLDVQDLSSQEPVLPKTIKAYEELRNWFGESCIADKRAGGAAT